MESGIGELGRRWNPKAASTADLLRFQKNKLTKTYAYTATVIILCSGFIPLHGESYRVSRSTDLFCQSKDVDFCSWINFLIIFTNVSSIPYPLPLPKAGDIPVLFQYQKVSAWVSKLAGKLLCFLIETLLFQFLAFLWERKHSSSKRRLALLPWKWRRVTTLSVLCEKLGREQRRTFIFSVIYFSFGKCGFWLFRKSWLLPPILQTTTWLSGNRALEVLFL